jgi:hypothetical protein
MKILDPDKQYSLPEPETKIEALVIQLYRTAGNWRKTKNPEYVQQYHAIYDELRALGWDDAIDIEGELPNNLMPQHYLSQVASAKTQYNREVHSREIPLNSGDCPIKSVG